LRARQTNRTLVIKHYKNGVSLGEQNLYFKKSSGLFSRKYVLKEALQVSEAELAAKL